MEPARRHGRRLTLVAIALLCACRGSDKVVRPEYPKELHSEISSFDEPLSLRDDYWTENLGSYLKVEQQHTYWIQPEDKRFVKYGERWLEFCLREDLLKESDLELSPEQVDLYRSRPDFDSGRRTLEGFGRTNDDD